MRTAASMPAAQARARRRRITRRVRRIPLRRGFDEPFEDEEALLGGDEKPAEEP